MGNGCHLPQPFTSGLASVLMTKLYSSEKQRTRSALANWAVNHDHRIDGLADRIRTCEVSVSYTTLPN